MTRGIFTSGADSSAAELNDCFDPPRVRVYNSANLTLTTATDTLLTFNSERFDVGACHSTSVNTSRLTVPTGGAGYYLWGANLRFAANATGSRAFSVWVNGTASGSRLGFVRAKAIDGSTVVGLHLSGYDKLSAGDYLEVVAFQDSGGNLDVVQEGQASPEFWMKWDAVF